MRKDPLRLGVLISGSVPSVEPCDVTCDTRNGNFTELWLRCSRVEDLIQTLISIASTSVILATGGIDGSVFRPLPRDLEELIRSCSRGRSLEAGSTIIIQPCNMDLDRTLAYLMPYSEKIMVKRGSSKIKVVLSKPINTEQLFDLGIRLLKPVTAPAILLSGSRKRKLHGAQEKEQ